VLAWAKGLRLRTSATALAVGLTATAVCFRARCTLLGMRSFLTRSHLRPRLRTATTVEVLLRRLRRRPRRRGHVVHFTLLLLRSAVHCATAGIGL
jgi:hypothetical protein